MGPALWEQAPKQARKCSRPLHKLPEAYSLALAAHPSQRWFCSTRNPPSSPHLNSLIYPPTTFHHEASVPRVPRRNRIDEGRFG
jgi:hypothetical protein